jgi:hypothetical protein
MPHFFFFFGGNNVAMKSDTDLGCEPETAALLWLKDVGLVGAGFVCLFLLACAVVTAGLRENQSCSAHEKVWRRSYKM